MKRQALIGLKSWLAQENSKPLILRGARQVGKSTLVTMLAEDESRDLLEVNLEIRKIPALDNRENFSLKEVLRQIELATNKKITEHSLIFLDEIQAQPLAINALRYFYEQMPTLKVIAAGSLLEFAINKSEFSMPVGRVHYHFLGPMTFLEFLEAKEESIVAEQIAAIDLSNPPSRPLHLKALNLLKEYYLTGGMPEVVKTFVNTQDFNLTREVQLDLIHTFRDDIPKYTNSAEASIVNSVLDYSLGKIGEKVVFKDISAAHSSRVRNAIDLLSMANIIYKVSSNTCSGLPLQAGIDKKNTKLYFLDIGLFNAAMETSWNDIFKLNPEELLIQGRLSEQFIAQHLVFRNYKTLNPLYYWQRNKPTSSAEVDFIISHNGKIYPLEVKAGKTGKMRSLWQYISEKSCDFAIRTDLTTRDSLLSKVQHRIKTAKGIEDINCNLLGIPLYAIENLSKILDET